ncbi:MAG TPA: hypothetical protein VJ810_36060 [Blastocatellia bacterium]|nr:hypothetical protein [Blastocatellia bacterium]
MKIRAYFIFLLTLLAFSGHTCLAQTSRNLTRYDDGGSFNFHWGVGPAAAPNQMLPKFRDFLWEHWTQKRLARVVVIISSIEGDPTTYNLFVEPDRNQRWRVIAEYKSWCCWFYAMEKPRKRKYVLKKGVTVYDVVERVQISRNDLGNWSIIPEEDRREPDSYFLRLRRTSGGNKSDGALTF